MSGYIHQLALVGDPPEDRRYSGGFYHPPAISPSARLEAFVTVDGGLHQPTRIGPRTWLFKHSHVGHDAQIGADCELTPGTVIGGHCVVGDRVKFGLNSCVKPFVTIGDGARIGMGAVVIHDVPAGEVWVGNPAKQIG